MPLRSARVVLQSPAFGSSCVAIALVLATQAGGCARRTFGPNDAYRDPRVSADDWRQLFERDGRGEMYQKREEVIRLADIKPGMSVVDVGAGTGLFSMMLSDAVGANGRVYAEEVVDKFTRYIAERSLRENRANVVSVAGTSIGIGLPPHSVDLAFLCDVYHHFDHPAEMLGSIRRALREGGELFLVDFKRDPSQSPAWVLEHVRAGEAQVVREIEQAGFESRLASQSLHDSYALRFRRSSGIARGHGTRSSIEVDRSGSEAP